ncbi:polysaccharide ABC transporter ATP-binding protein [endosymbiont 'TC1' of Trimyema compressum]|uniref:ABC transporter ATP-binding protein n=1 Tax=endosymbiont 'TC1' of Trimyema compressum TaxID=243899 RepID=UPI000B4D51FD|nr:polysaccharide ABC transporter ATP-binding protein [endosymbiont 'TC1' of Trimyema compressum]
MMNNDKVIEVVNLNKSYKLFKKNIYKILDIFAFGKKLYTPHDVLKDVTFDVYKGEVLGIIGSNGAGKSTLLKLISGVSTPTSGSIKINGNVVSLLELGSTFNMEMTGIENLKLFFTIMLVDKDKMQQYVEEAIKFADIGEYVNHPVKFYSSGMFARLAFAASVQVEPEILVLDEVLSVGDIDFQSKSLEKIIELKNKGETILLVSHSFSAVNSFCDRVIWLKDGVIHKMGDPKIITQAYHFNSIGYENNSSEHFAVKEDSGAVKLNNARINRIKYQFNEDFQLELDYKVEKKIPMDLIVEIWKYQAEYPNFLRGGELLIGKYYGSNHQFDATNSDSLKFFIEKLNLGAGQYYIDIAFSNTINSKLYLHVFNVADFVVSSRDKIDDGIVLMDAHFNRG